MNIDCSSVYDLSKGEIDVHLQILPLIKMLKENVPGFEDIYLSSIAQFMGVRESRRIIGKQMIREEAALNAEVHEDTIVLGSYIIDIHSVTDDSTIIMSLKDPYGITYGTTI